MSDNGSGNSYYSVNEVRKKLKTAGGEIVCLMTGLEGRHGAYTDLTLVHGTEVTTLSVNRSRVPVAYRDDFRCFPKDDVRQAFDKIGLSLTAVRPTRPVKSNGHKPALAPETLLSQKAIFELTAQAGGAIPFFIESGGRDRHGRFGETTKAVRFSILNLNDPARNPVSVWAPTLKGASSQNKPFLPYIKLLNAFKLAGLRIPGF